MTKGPHKSSSSLLLLPLLSVGVCLVCATCGDAYSTQVPTQMLTTSMYTSTDYARLGDDLDLDVVIYAPESSNFVTGYEFGDGIDVYQIVSGPRPDCDPDTSGITVPTHFEQVTLFPVCISAIVDPDATIGMRTFSIQIQSNGTPVIAREVLFVLGAL